ncbi:hypothetical protein [Bradyrhizobium sp. USDA 3364]
MFANPRDGRAADVARVKFDHHTTSTRFGTLSDVADQRDPSRGFGGVTSTAAAMEIPAAIAISVVATSLFRVFTIIVSDCRCRIVRNAE